jgi:hypothetical protein
MPVRRVFHHSLSTHIPPTDAHDVARARPPRRQRDLGHRSRPRRPRLFPQIRPGPIPKGRHARPPWHVSHAPIGSLDRLRRFARPRDGAHRRTAGGSLRAPEHRQVRRTTRASHGLTRVTASFIRTTTARTRCSRMGSTSSASNTVRASPCLGAWTHPPAVVLAGHTGCGGAAACYQAVSARSSAPSPKQETPLSRWLAPLTALVASLDLSSATPDAALDVIVQANVKRQVEHICAAEPVRKAWAAGKPLSVHGWVYDVASGRIKDLGVSRGPSAVPHAQL